MPIQSGCRLDLLTHVLLLNGLFAAYSHSIDMAFWTLSTEWQFYVAFPFLWFSSRRWSPVAVAASGLVVSWGFALAVKVSGERNVSRGPLCSAPGACGRRG